jgi:hypothetical protein
MKWIKDHKALFYTGILLVLLGLGGFFIFQNPAIFLISREDAIQAAGTACGDPVQDSSLNIQAYVDRYKNVPPVHVIVEPRNNWLPVWIVTVDANWIRSGGPIAEPNDPPVTLAIYDRCTVVVDALTGDVLLADVPPPIE